MSTEAAIEVPTVSIQCYHLQTIEAEPPISSSLETLLPELLLV